MLQHACGFALAQARQDTRAIQEWLGYRNIQHSTRYTELTAHRFKDFWQAGGLTPFQAMAPGGARSSACGVSHSWSFDQRRRSVLPLDRDRHRLRLRHQHHQLPAAGHAV